MRLAAGVILVQDSQVYLVRRGTRGSFFPGFHAFVGGGQEKGDSDCGLEPQQACALRELFEETGVWLGPSSPTPEQRRELLQGSVGLAQLLSKHPVEPERLWPAGLRITPEYSAVRFEAQFYLVEGHCMPEVWPGELEDGAWWPVEAALRAWERAEIALAAPTLEALRQLARNTPLEAARALQHSVLTGPISLSPGLTCLPMETPTLPPARHTVCCLVGGERLLVLDPGGRVELEGRQVAAVVISHHHSDHTQGAEWARAQGFPLAAHPQTAQRLSLAVDQLIEDGHCWDLGVDRAGLPWLVQALHTPGHAPGHLALWNPSRRLLLAGDLVSGASTIVIDPPEGDMAAYMASLERMRDLEPGLVVPAHGTPFGPGSDIFRRFLQHRRDRESRILEALGEQALDVEALLARAYSDTPVGLWPLASRSLLAHLIKLEGEGRAGRTSGGWVSPLS